MREEELSIGDWVKVNVSTRPQRVSGICDGRVKIGANWFWCSDIIPAPLSLGAISKNGWELKNGVMVFKNDVIRLGWKEDGTLIFGYYEWPIKVNYIHQLQHILRDVGLVEYANSMRV